MNPPTLSPLNSNESVLARLLDGLQGFSGPEETLDRYLECKELISSSLCQMTAPKNEELVKSLKQGFETYLWQRYSLPGVATEESLRILASLSKAIFEINPLPRDRILEGLQLVRSTAQREFVWQTKAGERVLAEFRGSQLRTSCLRVFAALQKAYYFLQRREFSLSVQSIENALTCIPIAYDEPKLEALFRELRSSLLLPLNRFHSRTFDETLTSESIQKGFKGLGTLFTALNGVSPLYELYDSRIKLPDEDLQRIEALQEFRLAPQGTSKGLKGIYTFKEMQRWRDNENMSFLIQRRENTISTAVLIQIQRSNFPLHVQEVISQTEMNSRAYAYVSLLVNDGCSALDSTLEEALENISDFIRSEHCDGFIAWNRADHPILIREAQSGLDLINVTPRKIREESEYQAVYVCYSLQSKELRLWRRSGEIDKAKTLIRIARNGASVSH